MKQERRICPRFNLIEFWGGVVAPRITSSEDMFFPLESGRITDNVFAIKDDDVNVFVYTDGENTVCIDCGFKNNPDLGKELKRLNVNPDSINHLFLTHTDMDHAGSVSVYSNVHLFDNPFYSFWNIDTELDIRSIWRLATLEKVSVLLTSHTRYTFEFKKAMEEWM